MLCYIAFGWVCFPRVLSAEERQLCVSPVVIVSGPVVLLRAALGVAKEYHQEMCLDTRAQANRHNAHDT